MTKFAYDNIKSTYMSYNLFEFYYKYNPSMFFKDETNLYSKSCFTNKLTKKLREPIKICC